MITNRAHAMREQKLFGRGPVEFFSDGKSPAVVALHGFGGTAAELMPSLRALAAAGFTVDAPLLPGHGTRVEALQGETFASWLTFARGRAETAAAKHGRVVVIGFSMGSLLALQLASERPRWLAGIVVLGNALTVRAHSSLPLGAWDWSGRPMPDVYLRKPLPGDLFDPTLIDTVVTYNLHPLRAALEVYRAGLQTQKVIGRIDAPILILHGVRDRVCHWNNAPWLASHVASADVSLRLFERSAHVLACDTDREQVARETVSFVNRFG